MKHIQQLRQPYNGERSYYEVPQGTSNAIECKQGEHVGKWFITLEELESRNDIEPNFEGELYLITHIYPYVFQPIEEAEPQPFDLRDWELSVVEPAIRSHIESVIRPEPLDYISIHEPNTWIGDDEYGEEAEAVREWIRACWRSMKAQIEGLEAAIEVAAIIDNLPALNI